MWDELISCTYWREVKTVEIKIFAQSLDFEFDFHLSLTQIRVMKKLSFVLAASASAVASEIGQLEADKSRLKLQKEIVKINGKLKKLYY